jgi:uncharacterized protein YqjF (DUF2071 family)
MPRCARWRVEPTMPDERRQDAGASWVMRQTWLDLLFAHWPIELSRLRPLVPAQLPLDLHDGWAWIGVVPFAMTDVAPRGVPAIPWLSAFAELNVRTYVSLGGRAGVYFFSLDAERLAAVAAARALFGLPYFHARMSVERGGQVEYRSQRSKGDAEFVASYAPAGPPFVAAPGTLDHFLTERYCLYTVNGGRVSRLDISHAPWRLQPARAEIRRNTMLAASGIAQPEIAPVLHYAARQQMLGYWPVRVDPPTGHIERAAR